MTKAEKIEGFIRESFEMYGLDYEEFANSSVSMEKVPEEFRKIKDGLNMYAVTEAAKVLGVSPEDLLNMDDVAVTKWYKKYPYFFHITGFNYAYKRSFHDDNYDHLRMFEVLFEKPCTPKHPTRYDYDDVRKRLDSLLKEIDKVVPGTYHKNAEMTGIRVYTENFCHYEEITTLVESYIAMVNRAKELFFKAWETELNVEEVREYNILVSSLRIEDQECGSHYGYLYYDLLKKLIPVYREECYNDFFSYVRFNRHHTFQPWVCAEFALDKDLVQKFVEVSPNAKINMRRFAMMTSKFQCIFTWSDAEKWDMQNNIEDIDWAIKNLDLLRKNGCRELTEIYVPKTSEEMKGDDRFAEMLKVLSGPVKLGGVATTTSAAGELSQYEHIQRMDARITAIVREVPNE